MGDTMKDLLNRRSCRKYKEDLVPEDVLDEILKAGTYAATAGGRQSPVILAVNDRKVRDELSRLNAAVMNGKGDPFYGAPQVIVVLADKNVGPYVCDGSLVLGNMMLAAEALGVSSCWIHRAKEVFETEEGKAILKAAGIEGDYVGIGNLIIGYDDGGKREAAPRKENYIYKL